MIRFLASEPHYWAHLKPIYQELEPFAEVEHVKGRQATSAQLTVVASWKDYQQTSGPVVFLEHGSGITYKTANASYAGAQGRDRVVLFCNVNRFVDEANRAAYPNAGHAIVGDPALDTLLQVRPASRERPVVAFSWHWDCRVVPETQTALPHYQKHLEHVADGAHWQPLGHSHPRGWAQTKPLYQRLGWQIAPTFLDVVAAGNVYVCDNSSTIYEWAALDRPVVVLNAPWYRRDIDHGPLRFWQRIPGIQVDHPADLPEAIDMALTDDQWSDRRQAITSEVYPHLGQSATIAANAIRALGIY